MASKESLSKRQRRRQRVKDTKRTKLCNFFSKHNSCHYGDSCKYAHSTDDLDHHIIEEKKQFMEENAKEVSKRLGATVHDTRFVDINEDSEFQAIESTVGSSTLLRFPSVVERYYTTLFIENIEQILPPSRKNEVLSARKGFDDISDKISEQIEVPEECDQNNEKEYDQQNFTLCQDSNPVGQKMDQYISFHSNKLCIVGLSPFHPALQPQASVSSNETCAHPIIAVNFDVANKNRLENVVKGKKKKGGIWLEPHSPICSLECRNGNSYFVYSGIRASLLEVNDRLVDNPELLNSNQVLQDGFIAILRPKMEEIPAIASKLTPSDIYFSKMK